MYRIIYAFISRLNTNTVDSVLRVIADINVFYVQVPTSFSSASRGGYGVEKPRDLKRLKTLQDTSFNLNKARHEVRQLGIKGLNNESKEEAILNKLIQLGAKVHDYCSLLIVCTFLVGFPFFVN